MKNHPDKRDKRDDPHREPEHVPAKPLPPLPPAYEALGWQEAESGRALADMPI